MIVTAGLGAAGRIAARCEELISTLSIPRPFDLDEFLSTLATQRGKRIVLVPTTLRSGHPCGLLLSTVEVDYIYCATQLPPLHSQHTVMHEVGHLLFGHGTAPGARGETPRVAGVDALRLLLPALPEKLISRILGRVSYVSEQEQEAELFASLVLARATSPRRRRGRATAPAAPLPRLGSVFDVPDQPGAGRG